MCLAQMMRSLPKGVSFPSNIVLVGRSWGGGLVMQALAEHLEEHRDFASRVCAIVLVAPNMKQLRFPSHFANTVPVLVAW